MKTVRILAISLLLLISATAIACARPAPAPAPKTTPAPAPVVKPSPAPAPAAWQPVWKDGKLQPLPDGFPARPITVWNKYGPGHQNQIYAQLLTAAAKDLSPVALAVENAQIGPRDDWAMLEKFPGLPGGKEGYHVYAGAINTIAVGYFTTDRGGQTLDDMKFILQTEGGSMFLIVKPDAPWKTVEDLLAYGKANPGKLRLGVSVGTIVHILDVALAKASGFEWVLVPHSSVSAAYVTLQGGGIEVTNGSTSGAGALITEGKLKALGTFGETVDPAFPSAPVIKVPGMPSFSSTTGLVTGKDVPDLHVRWMNELFKKASQQQSYKDYVAKTKANIILKEPDQIRKTLDELIKVFGPIINDLGLAAKQTTPKK